MDIARLFGMGGRTCIVTGASSGLGVAFAEALASAGANVVVVGRRLALLHETARLVERGGKRALAVQADVAIPEDCNRVVEAALEMFERIDVLVNNAGVSSARPATQETPDEFRQIIDINLNGTYWMAQACGRVMQPGSSIVNIGSVLGVMSAGLPQAAYSSSKAALVGLTRDLAQQWTGRKGIRVNVLTPGLFSTDMSDRYEESYRESLIKRIPMHRMGTEEELCAAMLFLASDASSYVSGSSLVVDGGLLTT